MNREINIPEDIVKHYVELNWKLRKASSLPYMEARSDAFEYIKTTYKVPAEIGREILYKGDKKGERKGIIIEDRGNYIGVNFYDDKPEVVVSLHPTWEIEYLGIGKVRKVSKSRMRAKQRYEEYRNADWYSGTFAEWLGIKPKIKRYD